MNVSIFRPMEADGKEPKPGNSCTKLGVRDREVVFELDEPTVVSDRDGPSVVTRLKAIPKLQPFLHPFVPFLLPARFRREANVKVELFEYKNDSREPFEFSGPIDESLKLMKKKHSENSGYIATNFKGTLDEFRNSVNSTRPQWDLLEWQDVCDRINSFDEY